MKRLVCLLLCMAMLPTLSAMAEAPDDVWVSGYDYQYYYHSVENCRLARNSGALTRQALSDIGDLTPCPVCVEEYFRDENGKPLPGLLEADPRPFAESVLREEEDLPAAQSHLILWFRAGGVALGCPGQAATAVAAELLGQSPVSLLFMNVREKLGLCYTVSAYYNPIHAALCVFCGLSAQNREVAEREILAQTDNLREGRFTDADLTAAKKSLRGALSRLEDRPSSLENFWFNRSLAGIRETPAEYAARVDAVTREEVVAAARLLSLDTVYFLRGTAPGKEFDDVETDEA